jgi:hypothetical protein
VRRILRSPSGSDVVRRENGDAPASPEPRLRLREPSLALPRPRLSLNDEGGLDHLHLLLNLTPQLIAPLLLANPSLFNVSVVPTTAPAAAALSPTTTGTSSPSTQTAPSTGSSTPSLPSSATLLSHEIFNLRLVFEEPSITLPPDLAEREQRFRQAFEPTDEPAEVDTGELVKGLITAFLTTTPPGQAILQALTGALGGGEPSTGPSVDINFDVIPTPLLEGRPPSIQLGIEGTF